MDQAMMESIMAFPAATAGLGNQPLEPTILADGTKHFELTTSIVDWEVAPGQDRPGLGLQRPGARPAHRPRGRRHRRGRAHQRAADRHRHPHARHRPAQRPGRRRPDHPGPRRHRRDVHLPLHRHRAGDRHVPRPRPRRPGHPQRPVRHDVRRRDRPAGRAHGLRHRDPRRPHHRPGHPDGRQRRRHDRPHAQRQELPGHRPARRRRGRLGQGHLLQRGPAGPPDAPPRLRADRLRQGRRTARPALRRRHHPRRPRRALHGAVPRRPARHLGLALPHPQPRRSRRPACSAWSPPSSSTTAPPDAVTRRRHRDAVAPAPSRRRVCLPGPAGAGRSRVASGPSVAASYLVVTGRVRGGSDDDGLRVPRGLRLARHVVGRRAVPERSGAPGCSRSSTSRTPRRSGACTSSSSSAA